MGEGSGETLCYDIDIYPVRPITIVAANTCCMMDGLLAHLASCVSGSSLVARVNRAIND